MPFNANGVGGTSPKLFGHSGKNIIKIEIVDFSFRCAY